MVPNPPRGSAGAPRLTPGLVPGTSGPAIFISYRRDDTRGYAGHLASDLRMHYGPAQVFDDVDGIDPGADFPQLLERRLQSCQVLLAVIGKSWLQATDSKGRRRLDDPRDWVRLEIAAALARKIPVIPVLVGNATPPDSAKLPAPLERLATHQALEISDTRWDYDLQRLFKVVDSAVALPLVRPIGGVGRTADVERGGAARVIALLLGLLVMLAIAGGGIWTVAHIVSASVGPRLFGAPPTLTLSPDTAAPGAKVTVTGTGFQAGETIDVYFHATLVGMARADTSGSFSKAFTVPVNAPPPNFPTTVHATGESSIRTAQAPFSTRAP